MLNITSPQGNGTQNHNELSIYTQQNGKYPREKKNRCNEFEKLEPLRIAERNVKWSSQCRKG